MKSYYYLLFRIYMFYKDTIKEKTHFSLSTSLVSTVLISLNLMTFYFLFDYLDLLPTVSNKYYVVILMAVVWIINYYGIVRKEKFLKYGFKKDKKGGYIVVSIMGFTFLLGILVANLNRQKIFKEREEIKPKKESLEGKIRKWFE